MAYRLTSVEQIIKARDLLVAGGKIREVAKAIGVSTDTICRWMAIGPPCDVPGVAPKDVPLVFSAIRFKDGVSVDTPLNEGEQLYAVKLAARQFIREFDRFVAVLGVSREEAR